ncbi:MAG: hypothetical protein NTY16_04445 [Deltaproteobacteria bacterium]|nr:hypothetical protein [Deltaproteobacteria bacterium]
MTTKCKCGGTYKPYDGCLGYESMKCDKCNADIIDLKIETAAAEMYEALSNIVWKLDRDTDQGPAKIDRKDIVIIEARRILARLTGLGV